MASEGVREGEIAMAALAVPWGLRVLSGAPTYLMFPSPIHLPVHGQWWSNWERYKMCAMRVGVRGVDE